MVWLDMMLVTWVMYTLFKPYTIVQIYVRTSKSCKTVEISTITIDVKLQNLTKKCPWSQKVPLILIMSTFLKKIGGTFQKIKSYFCHFLLMLSPSPLHHYHIIIPSPTLSYPLSHFTYHPTLLFYTLCLIYPLSPPINTLLNLTYKYT